MDPAEPTIYVVDDDEAVRDSLRWLIASVDLDVETHGSAKEFLEAFEPGRPGCLLVDVRMPGMSGLELQKHLAERAADLPVVIITGHGDVQMAVNAMKDGAFDFIEKPFNDQPLLNLVQRAVEYSYENAREHARRNQIKGGLEKLTFRERQILDMIVAGESNRNIAVELRITPKTVEAHRAKVMAKMQATSLADLIKRVVSLDLD